MSATPDLKGKVVALVGGGGFIGHNMALQLQKQGADVHIIDSLQVNNLGAFTSGWNPSPNNDLYVSFINQRLELLRQAKIALHVIDCRDYSAFSYCLGAIKPNVVVQLAATWIARRVRQAAEAGAPDPAGPQAGALP